MCGAPESGSPLPARHSISSPLCSPPSTTPHAWGRTRLTGWAGPHSSCIVLCACPVRPCLAPHKQPAACMPPVFYVRFLCSPRPCVLLPVHHFHLCALTTHHPLLHRAAEPLAPVYVLHLSLPLHFFRFELYVCQKLQVALVRLHPSPRWPSPLFSPICAGDNKANWPGCAVGAFGMSLCCRE